MEEKVVYCKDCAYRFDCDSDNAKTVPNNSCEYATVDVVKQARKEILECILCGLVLPVIFLCLSSLGSLKLFYNLSAIFVILGIVFLFLRENIRHSKWRIVAQIICCPGILLILIFLFLSPQGQTSDISAQEREIMRERIKEKSREKAFRNAKHDYEEASRHYRDYKNQGLEKDANRWQHAMDKAFAEMMQNKK